MGMSRDQGLQEGKKNKLLRRDAAGFEKIRVRAGGFHSLIWMLVAAGVLLALGHFLVLQRSLNAAAPELKVGGDTINYLAMTEGDFSRAREPFRYRVLAPLLASLLPLPPLSSLRAVTYASLFFSYLLSLWICGKLELEPVPSFLGLFSVFASTWHLYYFHNPFLTDGSGLLFLFILFAAFFQGAYPVFLSGVMVGALAREATLFLAPLWLVTRQWLRAAAAIAGGVAVFLAVRHLLHPPGGEFSEYLRHALQVQRLRHPLRFMMEIFLAWRHLWIALALGLCLAPSRAAPALWSGLLLLVSGSLLSCLFATDVGRILNILTPVVVIAAASLFQALKQEQKPLYYTLAALLIPHLFASMPTVLTPRESWVFVGYGPRIALMAATVSVLLAAGLSLKSRVKMELKEKYAIMLLTLKEPFRAGSHEP